MNEDIDQLKLKIVPILKSSGVTRSAIFGSYVRGEQKPDSDIDILVAFPEGLSLFDVAAMKIKLEDSLGKEVDLVEYDKIKPRLRKYILSEQVAIL